MLRNMSAQLWCGNACLHRVHAMLYTIMMYVLLRKSNLRFLQA
ncbi:hypothetical protein ATPR_0835 [Acetobacter tropicalis NBRC 101654]|uniref:Uncharacterized protein n=1 Tax=Acetobacter tropicalis NBRC 101654 TaxID=749388 RepID=F7VBT6_9PROT|nr:hypothetical protein ATPR_0835 [Acetobacter tropicalis NBRC 101654]